MNGLEIASKNGITHRTRVSTIDEVVKWAELHEWNIFANENWLKYKLAKEESNIYVGIDGNYIWINDFLSGKYTYKKERRKNVKAEGKKQTIEKSVKKKNENHIGKKILIGIGITVVIVCVIIVISGVLRIRLRDGIWPPLTIPLGKKRRYFAKGGLGLVEAFDNIPARNVLKDIASKTGIKYHTGYLETGNGVKSLPVPNFKQKFPICFNIPEKMRIKGRSPHFSCANAMLYITGNSNWKQGSWDTIKLLLNHMGIEDEQTIKILMEENYISKRKFIELGVDKNLYKFIYPNKRQLKKNSLLLKKSLTPKQIYCLYKYQYYDKDKNPINMGKEIFNFTWHHEYSFGKTGYLRYVDYETHRKVPHLGGKAILKELKNM
jgi:hypothetical protein